MIDYEFDYAPVLAAWPTLFDGAVETVRLTAVSAVLSLLLSLVVLAMRRSSLAALRAAAVAFIEVTRNTPFLVQIFLIYFGLPQLGLQFTTNQAAVIALTINTTAFVAEILRGGVESQPRGQVEAGRALGLGPIRIFFLIVLKPSLRAVYPAIGTQLILMMLMSSIVVSIGAEELTYNAQQIEGSTFRSFETYSVVIFVYLFMSVAMSTVWKLFGRFYFAYPVR